MRSLNNRLKASDAKRKGKSQSAHAFKPPNRTFWGQHICSGIFYFFSPPENSTDEDYGSDAITSFANHFLATLTAARYDQTKVLNEITLSLAQYC